MAPFLSSGHPHPSQSPGFLLWQVNNLWQRHQRMALEPLGITHVQFVLLAGIAWLARSEQHPTQVQLAQHAGADVMMTSQVVRSLEEKGLLQRMPHPHDSRAKTLSLTNEGRLLVEQAIGVVEAVDRRFFGILEHHQADLVVLLQQLMGSK